MKIIFFGSDDFALAHLDAIMASDHHVMACVTQPDRAKGRGMKVAESPIKVKARECVVPCFQPENIKDKSLAKILSSFEADVFVVVAYGQILPSEILNIPQKLCVNVHGSLLPQYRGAAPINWAVINGDKETGITIIKMSPNLDGGAMLAREKLSIGARETAPELRARMMALGCKLLIKVLDQIADDKVESVAQNDREATRAPKLTKELGAIDWKLPAERIDNLVRGLLPWPAAYTFVNGKMLKILEAETVARKSAPQEIGCIVEIKKDGFLVGCGQGALLVKRVHLEAANPMTAKNFLAGHKVAVGFRFG